MFDVRLVPGIIYRRTTMWLLKLVCSVKIKIGSLYMYVELILGMTMYMYYMFYWMRFCEKKKLNDMQDEWSLLKKCLHGVKTFYFRIYIYFPLFADIRYGFKLETPKRALHCSVESEEEKFNWISLLEQAIRSAIDIQWCHHLT